MNPRPRTLALIDAILVALRDEAGTPDEIASRIGNVPCKCWESGSVGTGLDGNPCWCAHPVNGTLPGWRRCGRHDVYRLLVQLRERRVIERYPDPRGVHWPASWALLTTRAPDDLEALWELPAQEKQA